AEDRTDRDGRGAAVGIAADQRGQRDRNGGHRQAGRRAGARGGQGRRGKPGGEDGAGAPGEKSRTTRGGGRGGNDREGTGRRKAPTIDVTGRLGHSAGEPRPDAAGRDRAAGGRNPSGNGPDKRADGPAGPAGEHNGRSDRGPNPDDHG
ncbi:hypothetical protein C3R44_22915, partial [Mycobacterium tuberculosis]